MRWMNRILSAQAWIKLRCQCRCRRHRLHLHLRLRCYYTVKGCLNGWLYLPSYYYWNNNNKKNNYTNTKIATAAAMVAIQTLNCFCVPFSSGTNYTTHIPIPSYVCNHIYPGNMGSVLAFIFTEIFHSFFEHTQQILDWWAFMHFSHSEAYGTRKKTQSQHIRNSIETERYERIITMCTSVGQLIFEFFGPF